MQRDPLEELRRVIVARSDEVLVAAIDRCRAEGVTWEAISAAMGHDDRNYARLWRRRKQ